MSAMPLPVISWNPPPVTSCDDCGVCCEHAGWPPFLIIAGDEEFHALPEELQAEIMEAIATRRGDRRLPCVWYDGENRRCRHHNVRPAVCRDFEVGGKDCIDVRLALLVRRKLWQKKEENARKVRAMTLLHDSESPS